MKPIRVNPDELAPTNSYVHAPRFWKDTSFRCRDCGDPQVFTAEAQRVFYEVEKNPIYATRVRCRPCEERRIALRENRRVFADVLATAKRSDDPALIRAGVHAILTHGAYASGGAKKALRMLLDRLPPDSDDELVCRARMKARS